MLVSRLPRAVGCSTLAEDMVLERELVRGGAVQGIEKVWYSPRGLVGRPRSLRHVTRGKAVGLSGRSELRVSDGKSGVKCWRDDFSLVSGSFGSLVGEKAAGCGAEPGCRVSERKKRHYLTR